MSHEIAELQNKINELTEINKKLTEKSLAHSQESDMLIAQIDSHKSMLNESLNATLNLRAHFILAEKQNKKLNEMIDTLTKQIEQANKRIAEDE